MSRFADLDRPQDIFRPLDDSEATSEQLLHDYFALVGLTEGGSIYISNGDSAAVVAAYTDLANTFGLVVERDGEPEVSSWFARFNIFRHTSVQDRLSQVERAVQLKYIGGQRSENDEREAAGVSNLIEALATTNQAVIRLSNMVLIKKDGATLVTVLSEGQIRYLEENPGLLKNAESLLDRLDTSSLVTAQLPEAGHRTREDARS